MELRIRTSFVFSNVHQKKSYYYGNRWRACGLKEMCKHCTGKLQTHQGIANLVNETLVRLAFLEKGGWGVGGTNPGSQGEIPRSNRRFTRGNTTTNNNNNMSADLGDDYKCHCRLNDADTSG